MSHVVSPQTSSTSPYPSPQIETAETGEDLDDCWCLRPDKSQGCFLYCCCSFLYGICGGFMESINNCCNCCENCLKDCCEDQPEKRNKRRTYRNTSQSFYDCDNDWGAGSDDPGYFPPITNEPSSHHSNNHHSGYQNSHCHDTGGHHDSGGHYDSGGGTCDSGWGGDSGGGCDSGGGGDTGCAD